MSNFKFTTVIQGVNIILKIDFTLGILGCKLPLFTTYEIPPEIKLDNFIDGKCNEMSLIFRNITTSFIRENDIINFIIKTDNEVYNVKMNPQTSYEFIEILKKISKLLN